MWEGRGWVGGCVGRRVCGRVEGGWVCGKEGVWVSDYRDRGVMEVYVPPSGVSCDSVSSVCAGVLIKVLRVIPRWGAISCNCPPCMST